MLILTRKPGQQIHIDCPDGARITLEMRDHGINARTGQRLDIPAIAIDAPQTYSIVRAEIEYRGKTWPERM